MRHPLWVLPKPQCVCDGTIGTSALTQASCRFSKSGLPPALTMWSDDDWSVWCPSIAYYEGCQNLVYVWHGCVIHFGFAPSLNICEIVPLAPQQWPRLSADFQICWSCTCVDIGCDPLWVCPKKPNHLWNCAIFTAAATQAFCWFSRLSASASYLIDSNFLEIDLHWPLKSKIKIVAMEPYCSGVEECTCHFLLLFIVLCSHTRMSGSPLS